MTSPARAAPNPRPKSIMRPPDAEQTVTNTAPSAVFVRHQPGAPSAHSENTRSRRLKADDRRPVRRDAMRGSPKPPASSSGGPVPLIRRARALRPPG
ncbi:MAG: hypothetical protein JWO02_331 [Solirubrobacterales bacterium]|nr:hypothetical protein [Solirubrobacterales bacterium]